LEILQTYQREQKPIQEVYSQVQVLFNGASDLLQEFKQFLPDASGGTGRLGYNRSNQGSGTSRRGKRTGVGYGGSNSRKRARTAPFKPIPNAALDKSGTLEELDFFDKVKTIIGNRTTYNEFLKILNLFSQELIDAKTLIDRVEPFLSSSTEVFEWFKKFVRYEEDDIICEQYFLRLS
jgi:paired amphipathic helix protein Sin3a